MGKQFSHVHTLFDKDLHSIIKDLPYSAKLMFYAFSVGVGLNEDNFHEKLESNKYLERKLHVLMVACKEHVTLSLNEVLRVS